MLYILHFLTALPTLDNFNKSLYTHIIGAFTTVDCTGHGHPVPTVTFHGLTCSNSEFHNIGMYSYHT